ncbi:MAG TPA: ABC transporter ATP-binding protein [Gemmataceae bacterium]
MLRLYRWLTRSPVSARKGARLSERRERPALAHAPAGASRARPRGAAPSLTASDLVRRFGQGETETTALASVSLAVYPGELNLLMGPSGSGKSTLLAVLSGLLRPDAGEVRALGQNLWAMSEREMEAFRLRHCSFIFQGYNLFPALTARQQLEIVLRWGERVTGREARKRAERVLCQLGLGSRMNLRPAQLSGGEKQRVAIGRALVKDPAFLFADEPTSALDWDNGRQVVELLREAARERGSTVLVVAHDHRLLDYADRVFRMADGRLAEGGEPQRELVPVRPEPRQELSGLAWGLT